MEHLLDQLTSVQKGVLQSYLDAVQSVSSEDAEAESVELWRVGWAGSFGDKVIARHEFWVARMPLVVADNSRLFLYGSLGDSVVETGASRGYENEFVGIYDKDDMSLANLVVDARAHDLFAGRLGPDHTFRLPDENQLRKRGYSNV